MALAVVRTMEDLLARLGDSHPDRLSGQVFRDIVRTLFSRTTMVINQQTDDYTLQRSDVDAYVRVGKATTVNVTVPPLTFLAGDRIHLRQSDDGQVTVVEGSNVNINSIETLKLRGNGATATLVCVGGDFFDITGDLEAA